MASRRRGSPTAAELGIGETSTRLGLVLDPDDQQDQDRVAKALLLVPNAGKSGCTEVPAAR
jgi:hypothetical protein